jgi:hypothetical protein
MSQTVVLTEQGVYGDIDVKDPTIIETDEKEDENESK